MHNPLHKNKLHTLQSTADLQIAPGKHLAMDWETKQAMPQRAPRSRAKETSQVVDVDTKEPPELAEALHSVRLDDSGESVSAAVRDDDRPALREGAEDGSSYECEISMGITTSKSY